MICTPFPGGFPFDVIIKTSKPLRGHDGVVVLDEDGIGKFHVDKIVVCVKLSTMAAFELLQLSDAIAAAL